MTKTPSSSPQTPQDFHPFHSAVNRIPVLRDEAERQVVQGDLPDDLFTDVVAPGHDRLEPDRWSGSIDLAMTVRTPLVFGQQTVRAEERGERHIVQVPTVEGDLDGRLIVPPTMVKGMISRAYETLTCSRFRVFGNAEQRSAERRTAGNHEDRLTYRSAPANALSLVPVRLGAPRQDGGFDAELLRGDTLVKEDYCDRGTVYPTMMAANLQASYRGQAKLVLQGGMSRLKALTPHGKRISCHMTLCLHGDRRKGAKYAYWQVTHIRNNEGNYEEAFRILDSVTTIEDRDEVDGYVYRTTADGDTPDRLFNRKHDERVFFDVTREGPDRVVVSAEVCDSYRLVVESYVTERQKEENLKKKHRPNRATKEAMKRQEQSRSDHTRSTQTRPERLPDASTDIDTPFVELKEGGLAYAVVHEDPRGALTVREILPTLIGRRAYRSSPAELARAQRVMPPAKRDEASAADRLFGYVVPRASDGARGGDVAARGRVSFGPVDTTDAKISCDAQDLRPLLSPKTTSARRFLTDATGRTPKASGTPLSRADYFAPGQLLGAAAYPVHRTILNRTGFPTSATERPASDGDQQANIAVGLTARSWVKVGSRLTCTLSFSNLSGTELAALLWVLTPENLVPPDARVGHDNHERVGFLRMGLGKPLGLGAVEVRIARDGFRVVKNHDLAAAYADLRGCMGAMDTVAAPSEYGFPADVERTLRAQPWVRAMQRAAFGFTDGRPVRYMTLDENKENNQSSPSGKPKPNRGQAPEDLCDTPKPTNVIRQERQAHTRTPYRGGPGRRR